MGVVNFDGKTLYRRASCFGYLIMSSFSSTLLLGILIFHSDASQSFFCLVICCIQQFQWLIILLNNLFHFTVEFFPTPKRKKKFGS